MGRSRAWRTTPDNATGNAAAIRKKIASQSLMSAVEKALEIVGGSGLFRSLGLERLVRDSHGVQFHHCRPNASSG